MKKIQQVLLTLMSVIILSVFGCGGPNDDKGSMDQKNSGGEGAIDSTRIPGFDSAHAADSSHASLSGQDALIHSAPYSLREAKVKII